ncbi:hypothetical protein [Bradyrhizobium canariense]|uniref:hypothetical protein n=1 Tax=Bradyrhizobium canariense TaxID=255045 RepID=UPI00142FD415|nr:hypothetical protein [Bradyrhizobium canariense]
MRSISDANRAFLRSFATAIAPKACETIQEESIVDLRLIKNSLISLPAHRKLRPDDEGTSTRDAALDNSVCVVHPKTGEEAWWPLFDETGQELFPELMPELDAIKERTVSGLIFRRDHGHRRGRAPMPWMTPRRGLDYLRATVKRIIRAAGLRDELSFTSFRHGGFTEGADSDLSDAEFRAAGRHRPARHLPTYAKRTLKQLVSGVQKRRAEPTKPAGLSE